MKVTILQDGLQVVAGGAFSAKVCHLTLGAETDEDRAVLQGLRDYSQVLSDDCVRVCVSNFGHPEHDRIPFVSIQCFRKAPE